MKSLKLIILVCAVSFGSLAFGQMDEIAVKYASTISQDEMRDHLTILASDEYEGRETGKKGQKMAAEYITKHFKSIGLTPGNNGEWLQEFPLDVKKLMGVDIKSEGQSFTFLEDFYSFSSNTELSLESDDLIFLGHGIDDEVYSDYNGQDVTDKIVVVIQGEPKTEDGMSMINEGEKSSKWSTNFRAKSGAAHKNGAAALFIIDKNIEKNTKRFASYIKGSSMSLKSDSNDDQEKTRADTYYVSKDMAAAILGVKAKKIDKATAKMAKSNTSVSFIGKSSITVEVNKEQTDVMSSNVLGLIEGSDPELKDEIVIITSHYDHLGMKNGEIYNGADDDGSGTTTVLELAEAFATAKENGHGPRRSILFMPVSGEEKGLLGSQYYSENPVYDLKNTVCNINIDMVGRVDEKHAESSYYTYVIGADRLSTDLHNINEKMNETYVKMELDYEFNEPDDPNQFYYRSDHYNFAKNGIPVVFFFTGVHEDYHKPTDTVDKIEFDRMQKIGQLAFHTAWELANRDDRIVVDKEDNTPRRRR